MILHVSKGLGLLAIKRLKEEQATSSSWINLAQKWTSAMSAGECLTCGEVTDLDHVASRMLKRTSYRAYCGDCIITRGGCT